MGERQPANGVLIVGHGTREPRGRDDFFELVHHVRRSLHPGPVAGCFLELAEPTIGQGIDRLLQEQVRRITVAPLMLFAAGHVRRDVPAGVARALAGRADVELCQAAHLGCGEPILALSRKRFQEAVRSRPEVPPDETVLVFVGRGASDAEAVGEMLRLADLRRRDAPVAQLRTAFLAMAEPRLGDVLEEVALGRPGRVVVQPHLLFEGRLMGRVRDEVSRVGPRHGKIDWVVAEALGPDRLLAERLIQSVRCVGEGLPQEERSASPLAANPRVHPAGTASGD